MTAETGGTVPPPRRRQRKSDPERHRTPLNWLADRILRGLIRAMRSLPYPARVRLSGWLSRRVIGPVAGWRGRALANLAHVWPDRPLAERRRIADAALDNSGRVLIENYSPKDLQARLDRVPLRGAGLAAAIAARDAGRPILFVGGHFGNYQVACTVLNRAGFSLGGLYRLMQNPYTNTHYVATIEAMGGPAFPRTQRGLAGFVRHIRQGGQGAILIDQHVSGGVLMDFLGRSAPTATAAGEIALRHGAQIFPFYARRAANGLDFEVEVEAPVTGDSAAAITQAITDSLAARVRADPGQWFWMHRRWKPDRRARPGRAAP